MFRHSSILLRIIPAAPHEGPNVNAERQIETPGYHLFITFSVLTNQENIHDSAAAAPSAWTVWLLFLAIFAAVQFASLFTPPLLDDVDAAHAQAAQHFVESGDWVTAKINGIRYIEKPPLPYWFSAALYKVFGENVFASHLPN